MMARWKLSVLGLAAGVLAALSFRGNPWTLFLIWALAVLALGCIFARWLR